MISTTLSGNLINRQNFVSEMILSSNTFNSGRQEITKPLTTFDLVNSSYKGTSFLLSVPGILLTLSNRTDVSAFFEPSIDCIKKAVVEQSKTSHKPISVGNFVL